MPFTGMGGGGGVEAIGMVKRVSCIVGLDGASGSANSSAHRRGRETNLGRRENKSVKSLTVDSVNSLC